MNKQFFYLDISIVESNNDDINLSCVDIIIVFSVFFNVLISSINRVLYFVSKDDVGSSNNMIGLFCISARIRNINCRCPPDTLLPSEPTMVSNLLGNVSINCCILYLISISLISFLV